MTHLTTDPESLTARVGAGAFARPGRAKLGCCCPRSHNSKLVRECLSENACSRMPAPMNREFPELPLVGVGAVIIEDSLENSRVLLVKRAHPPLQAQWSIPGGVLEVGELVRQAAVREAREETGLVVEPADLLGVYDRVLRNGEQRVQYHYVLIDFLCRRVAGELAAASDAAKFACSPRR